jgi:hypothetical protein
MARYLLGRWYLSMPRALGGGADAAAVHLGRATAAAPQADTRYLMGFAEALVAAGRPAEAASSLTAVIERTPLGGRGNRRVQRAEALLAAVHSTLPGVLLDVAVQPGAIASTGGIRP